MTNHLAALFNVLIHKGYNFLTVKGDDHHSHYILVNQRTRCAIMVSELGIEIALCLQEDVANRDYTSNHRVVIKCAGDFLAARELIYRFEDWYGSETE